MNDEDQLNEIVREDHEAYVVGKWDKSMTFNKDIP